MSLMNSPTSLGYACIVEAVEHTGGELILVTRQSQREVVRFVVYEPGVHVVDTKRPASLGENLEYWLTIGRVAADLNVQEGVILSGSYRLA